MLEADITDPKALKAAAAEVAGITGGTLDYLINYAAFIGYERNLLSFSHEDQDQSSRDFNINIVGIVFTINAVLPLLRKGTAKKVISLSSGVVDPKFLAAAGYFAGISYGTSKAALNLAAAAYAAEFKDEGIVFLALSPGLVDTSTEPPTPEMLKIMDGLMTRFLRPDGKLITPEQSVRMQLDVIDRWTVENTEAFISHHGNQKWM